MNSAQNDLYSRSALLSLGTLTLLAPALRLFPTGATELAGSATWLAALAALPVMLLYVRLLAALMERRREGENLQELALRALGRVGGRAMLFLMAAWMLLYAGFVLRSGADRLIMTIYPQSTPGGFSLVMGLVALAAVLSGARTIVRAARIVAPVVLAALLLMLLLAAFSVQAENLLPVTAADALPVLRGSVTAADIMLVGLYPLCFLAGGTLRAPGRGRDFSLWAVRAALLLTALSAAIIGCFGAEVTQMLTRPFFMLVQNLVFFSTAQRVEALAVMLWIFPDFVQVALFLFAGQYSLRLALGYAPALQGEGFSSLAEGRWLIFPCAVAAIACALVMAPDSASMALWSKTLIPALNLGFALILIPGVYIIGRARKAL